jgi:hypothetical protein
MWSSGIGWRGYFPSDTASPRAHTSQSPRVHVDTELLYTSFIAMDSGRPVAQRADRSLLAIDESAGRCV